MADNNQSWTFAYDRNGRITNIKGAKVSGNYYIYDKQTRVVRTYDAGGKLLGRTIKPASGHASPQRKAIKTGGSKPPRRIKKGPTRK